MLHLCRNYRLSSHLFYRLIIAFMLVGSLLAPLQPSTAYSPSNQAESLLERLTPEERVGQLFLISFQGAQAGENTPIYNLIGNHHVGGVILSHKANNFIDDPTLPALSLSQALTTTRQLQSSEWDASQQSQTQSDSGETYTPAYIPLLIGISQDGDGYPFDQILSGLTPQPNLMALGATWKPSQAALSARVLGKELSSLGFNLLLGPSLDVLETPKTDGTSDLGTRTFGGDPFWVSQLSNAYVQGIHEGSQGQIAVIPKHFPGHGSSDRLPEEEVATVRKSLEALQSFDLQPFFAVTGGTVGAEQVADGLLTSHIRYQGLQGNIRTTTRPVSLDPQAFNLLMQIPPLAAWRQSGGLMVSDNLGSQAVRRFYELSNQEFDPRRVALNAFLAGNDLLYIADFSSASGPDSDNAAIRTLDFFAQKYREDPAFAQRVDESVLRILNLKYRLYSSFSLGNVMANAILPTDIGKDTQTPFEIARQAATLISPSLADLDDTIPDPPNQSDRLVFLTDVRTAQQCSECASFPLISVNALQEVVIRRYGPQAGGQVSASNLSSFSMADLQSMLNNDPGQIQLENNLKQANWIILIMLDARRDLPTYQVLERFLTERPDLFQQKRLVLFAFNAPYYLDATNISKLTAFYALYTKIPQAIDVASYLLFRELRPVGASPVSVPGIGYNLGTILFPDPSQLIPLQLDLPTIVPSDTAITQTPTPAPEFRTGDIIPLRTGIILDHNGNPVPDGTPVEFIFDIGGSTALQLNTTQGGSARTTYAITGPGTLDIFARSENALSNSLHFDIPAPGAGTPLVTLTSDLIIVATEQPSQPTATPSPESTQSSETVATPSPVPASDPLSGFPDIGDWLIAVLFSTGLAWSAYRLSAVFGQVLWGMRAGFLALIGGLAFYSLLVLQADGNWLMDWTQSSALSILVATLAGAALGLSLTFAWYTLSQYRKHRLAVDTNNANLTPRSKTPPSNH